MRVAAPLFCSCLSWGRRCWGEAFFESGGHTGVRLRWPAREYGRSVSQGVTYFQRPTSNGLLDGREWDLRILTPVYPPQRAGDGIFLI